MKNISEEEFEQRFLEDLMGEINKNYFIPLLNVDVGKGLSENQKMLLDYSTIKKYEC